MTSIGWPDFTENLAVELASMPEGRTLTLVVRDFEKLYLRIRRDQEGLSAELVSLTSPDAAISLAVLDFGSPEPRLTHEAREEVLHDLGWHDPDAAHDDHWWVGPLATGRSTEIARIVCVGLSEALQLEAPRMLTYYARDEADVDHRPTMPGLGIYQTAPLGSPSGAGPSSPGLPARAPVDDARRALSRRQARVEPWSRLLGFIGTAIVIVGCIGLMFACAAALDDDGTGPKCGYSEMGPGDVCQNWVNNEYTSESTYEEMADAYQSAPQRRAIGVTVSGGLVALGITMNVVNGRIKRRLSI